MSDRNMGGKERRGGYETKGLRYHTNHPTGARSHLRRTGEGNRVRGFGLGESPAPATPSLPPTASPPAPPHPPFDVPGVPLRRGERVAAAPRRGDTAAPARLAAPPPLLDRRSVRTPPTAAFTPPPLPSPRQPCSTPFVFSSALPPAAANPYSLC